LDLTTFSPFLASSGSKREREREEVQLKIGFHPIELSEKLD